MTEQVEQKPRRKTSVYTAPMDIATGLPPGHDHGETRSRKVSFGSTGRPRNVSVGSMDGDYRTRKQSFGNDQDYRNRKISFSRRVLSVDERGWGTDGSATGRGTTRPNTYKMDPERPFREKPVKQVIENVLQDLEKVRYDSPVLMAAKARNISDSVKQRVKLLGFDRYKLVCVVCLGQKSGQEVQDVGRCLWDSAKDGFVSVVYENPTLFAVVSLYAVYQE
ncbi:tctex1 domain-containing protein 2-like [Asterias rubens]|uniref:tctex1 domain-containing protein 2-like n=1 Tax=Asterias rubens TaxID=7604 RepID=UPI001455A14C|nr:tctex1 domain-containing protein 2-like [Asterias rubens]XP_033636208.1 tctex1 domain-containing protein 2-like [Asterias rubens]